MLREVRQAVVSADQLCSLDRWAVTRGWVWAGECRFWTTCACLQLPKGWEGRARGGTQPLKPCPGSAITFVVCEAGRWGLEGP